MAKCGTFLLGLLACAAALPVHGGEMAFDEQKESIFVMRASPEVARLIAFNGKVAKGGFKFSLFTPARFTGKPVDGYIVGKAKAGEAIAVSTFGQVHACEDGTTVVFAAQAGTVAYVGDVEFTRVGDTFTVRITDDVGAARAFVDKAYPQWSGRLQPVPTKIMPVKGKCTPPTPDIIYLSI